VLFEPEAFSSPAEHYPATCVVFSFGKGLFMQGQRIGYVAVSPHLEERNGGDALARTLERLCRVMGFCTPTALMQLAIRRLLDAKPDLSALAARRERSVEMLTAAGYGLVPSQATFFLYPAIPGGDDLACMRQLAERGVLTLPARLFHHRGHLRLSLTATDAMLDRALPILAEVARERVA
jgi:aspartate aminotransferase